MIRVDYITVGEILLHTKNVILQSKESTTKLHVPGVHTCSRSASYVYSSKLLALCLPLYDIEIQYFLRVTRVTLHLPVCIGISPHIHAYIIYNKHTVRQYMTSHVVCKSRYCNMHTVDVGMERIAIMVYGFKIILPTNCHGYDSHIIQWFIISCSCDIFNSTNNIHSFFDFAKYCVFTI